MKTHFPPLSNSNHQITSF